MQRSGAKRQINPEPAKGLWPAIHLVRGGVGALLFIHGVARVLTGGVAPFGAFFESLGVPYGIVLAWAVTIGELIGAPLLGMGRFVVPLAWYFMVQLAVGIALVHAPWGWFVVGLGRNGMEYSVLLMVCLVAVMVAHGRRPAIGAPS